RDRELRQRLLGELRGILGACAIARERASQCEMPCSAITVSDKHGILDGEFEHGHRVLYRPHLEQRPAKAGAGPRAPTCQPAGRCEVDSAASLGECSAIAPSAALQPAPGI